MAVYPTIKVYIDSDNDDVLDTDISNKVVSDIVGEHGIFSFQDNDRIGNVGNIKFDVSNEDGGDLLAPFTYKVGLLIGVSVTYELTEKYVFFGRVTDVQVDSGEWGERRLHITVKDWFDIASNSRIRNIEAQADLTVDGALAVLFATIFTPPANTNLDTGFETFPNVFDISNPKTSVYSEMDKLVKSELGYLYLKFRETDDGETLRFENYVNRGLNRDVSTLPELHASFLKYHGTSSTSGYLKYHSTGKIKLSTYKEAEFDNNFIASKWVRGENIVNRFTVTNIPRNTDTSNVILYTLGSPIRLGSTVPFDIQGDFTNPDGGDVVNAFDVVTPVITTDYLLNAAEDGSGTDLSANLAQTFTYGANGFEATLVNNGPIGYLIQYNVRGKGIYKYNPVDTVARNTESVQNRIKKIIDDSIRRDYSDDFSVSKTFGQYVVATNRDSRNVLKYVDFIANDDEDILSGFMYLEQGDKVRIIENAPAHTGLYYIQGLKFRLSVNGIIQYSWFLKEDDETIYEPIAVRGTEVASPDLSRNALDFGVLPYMANMDRFSYSLWVKRVLNSYGALITRSLDDSTGRRGNEFYILADELAFYSYKTPTDGVWTTTNANIPLNQWIHICVTYNNTTSAVDPKFYVDGTLVSGVTESTTPSGTSDDDSDCKLILFSQGPNPAVPGQEYLLENRNFTLKDVRVYNKILTQAEVTELASGEDDYSTVADGKIFQGIYAPVEMREDYIDTTIVSTDWVLDIIQHATGIPYNEVTDDEDKMLRGLDLQP